jgi:hypothetical protein
MHRGSGYNEGSAVMQHSYGTVLFRLGQCQVLAGEHAKGRESLEEAVVVLGGETRLFSAIGEGWLRRRFLMLTLHSIVFDPPLPPPNEVDVLGAAQAGAELGAAYECLAQLGMSEKQQWRAAYCAIRALKLGLHLATLTPLVARGYTLLFHVASSHRSRWPSWVQRCYRGKALQTARQLSSAGQEAQLLDLYMG